MAEYWDVYDVHRRKTGKQIQRGQSMQQHEYHMVVNVWLKNVKGEWLISRRAASKSDPMKWESTGGSALAGEDSVTAAIREVKEELGINLDATAGQFVCTGVRQYDTYPDFVDVWVFDCNIPIENVVLQEEETCEAKWASSEEIKRLVASDQWIPMEKFYYLDLLGI